MNMKKLLSYILGESEQTRQIKLLFAILQWHYGLHTLFLNVSVPWHLTGTYYHKMI